MILTHGLPTYTYLYGYTKAQVTELATMPYQEALRHKITHGRALLTRLLEVHYMDQDSSRINVILAAVKFNEQLIQELL